MRALAHRAAVLLAVASANGACGSGALPVDAQAHEDCRNCGCQFGGVWCSAPVGYYTSDDAPVLVPGVEGWFLTWRVGEGMTPPAFGELLLFGEVYGRAKLAIIIDRPPADGVDLGQQCVDDLGGHALWAKIRGFRPVITYPVECNAAPGRQVVEPISAEEDAAQMCPERLPPIGSCKVKGTLLTPEGLAPQGEGLVFSTGYAQEGIGITSARLGSLPVTNGRFEAEQGTVVFVVQGYLPQIHCLPCGEYTFTLE